MPTAFHVIHASLKTSAVIRHPMMKSRSEACEIGIRAILRAAQDVFNPVDRLTLEGDRRRLPRHGQRFRILHPRLVFERVGTVATPPLDDVQRVRGQPDACAGVPRLVVRTRQPAFPAEGNHVDHQRVAFPPRRRVAHLRGKQILRCGVGPSGRWNDPKDRVSLGEYVRESRSLNNLDRLPQHGGARKKGRRATQRRVVVRRECLHSFTRLGRIQFFELRQIERITSRISAKRRGLPDTSQVRFSPPGLRVKGTGCRRSVLVHRHSQAGQKGGADDYDAGDDRHRASAHRTAPFFFACCAANSRCRASNSGSRTQSDSWTESYGNMPRRSVAPVHGPVSIFGSCTTTWYSKICASGRLQRSTMCIASDEVCGRRFGGWALPSQGLPLKFVTSTTSVSPSQCPTDEPWKDGLRDAIGCRPFSPTIGMIRKLLPPSLSNRRYPGADTS